MKVILRVSYAGETVEWTGLEFEDSADWEEILNDFLSNYDIIAINEETNEEIESEP